MQVIDEAREVKTLVVEKPEDFSYAAGQYVMLGFGNSRKVDGKQAIPITLSSSPCDNRLRLTVKKNKLFTSELLSCSVGDELSIKGPLGSTFNFDESHKEDLVMLCAGSGITPFMSILRYIKDKGLLNKAIMLNGNRSFDDIIYREELDNLSKLPNIFIMNTLEHFDDNWRGEKGFITRDMIVRYVEDLRTFTYMVCGSIAMNNAIEQALLELGVERQKIKIDKWQIPGKSDH